ncbi:MAG: epoxyqueuosine reductase QueH [Sphaerochaetaceae bacterium]|jgi:predicted adenine nucleotide alpha hydrolase (AANH) superfamily ATPase
MAKDLLLHCCCGPCSTSSILRLQQEGFNPILFFGNSNIYPASEAQKRYDALRRVADYHHLELIHGDYDHTSWLTQVKGFEKEPEKGKRCDLCFAYNLQEAATEAQKRGISYFSTTLSVSPHKSSIRIFSVGERHDQFVPIDFKKKGGYQQSIALSKELDLYRQDYCGCEFSLAEKNKRNRHHSHPTEHSIQR